MSPRYTLTPQAALDVLYRAEVARYADPLNTGAAPFSFEAFTAVFSGCPTIGFAFDGQPIGGMLFDGEQAHIAVLAEHHGRWAHLFRPACQWLFSLKAEIFVEIENYNTTALVFMNRNGWPCLRIGPATSRFRMTPDRRRHQVMARTADVLAQVSSG